MPVIAMTMASLRFYGDDLVVDELTAAMGRPPTGSMTKGEPIVRKGKVRTASDGTPLIASMNRWQYSVARRKPGDLDGQIRELFGALTDDLAVWRSLARFHPDLFVGLFMKEENEGVDVSAECLAVLASRGVVLSLDIYEPPGPEEENEGGDRPEGG